LKQPIFDNPTVGAALNRPTANPTNHGEGKALPNCGSKTEPQPLRHRRNFHVLNILPVTTLRTIDLGGKKISGPLFSRFWAEMSVFFEGKYAPEYVH
jgi:hypothetical protein